MPLSRRARATQFALVVVCFVAFAVYVGSVRLMPLHDDSHIIARIRQMSLLDIFSPSSSGGVEYRPTGTLFWILTRDLFGWFAPGILHFWNVLFHVLNVALVAALIARVSITTTGKRDRLLSIIAAASFALFPFSYQAVIAGGIYHPAMLLFGLMAIHAYLTYRQRRELKWLGLCGFALAAACLSHEAGFVFGPLIALVELVISMARRARIRRVAFALAASALLYPIGYRLLVNTMWTPARGMLTSDASGVLDKLLYYVQGLAWWVIAPLRPSLGSFELNTSSRSALALGTLALVGLGVWLAQRGRRLVLALFGLVWWLIAIAPSVVALPLNYITDTPRLMYVPSVGLALFWGTALASFIDRVRWPALRLTPLVIAGALLAWSATYIDARLNEVARLTPAFKLIDRSLHGSLPDLKLVLINPPFLLLPTQPSFLFGREGFSLWEPNPGYGPVGNWTATMSGVYRDGHAVRHAASLTDRNPYTDAPDMSFTVGQGNSRFKYGVFAPPVDDVALRQTILAADLAYRFDYDAPGLRLRRVASMQRTSDTTGGPHLATFARGSATIELLGSAAVRCDGHLQVNLTWHNSGEAFEPTAVFVHGIDAAGQQVFAADKDLLDGVLPVNELPHDLIVSETREIANATTFAQVQQVRVGLYARADAKRFTATRADGTAWDGNEIIVPVTEDADGSDAVCGQ